MQLARPKGLQVHMQFVFCRHKYPAGPETVVSWHEYVKYVIHLYMRSCHAYAMVPFLTSDA